MTSEHTEARPAPLRGYRVLNDEEKAILDRIKLAEEGLAELWGLVEARAETDPRLVHHARTLFGDAFMNLVRSVAKPRDPFGLRFQDNQQDEAEGVIPARDPEAYRG